MNKKNLNSEQYDNIIEELYNTFEVLSIKILANCPSIMDEPLETGQTVKELVKSTYKKFVDYTE